MNIRKIFTQGLVVSALLAVASCATQPYQGQARNVKMKPGQGGVVAISPDNRSEDRTKAEQIMAQTCSGKTVKVLEEGEVVVGQTTTSSGSDSYHAGTEEHKTGRLFGMDLMSGGEDPSVHKQTVTETTTKKEWQITYSCGKKS